MSSNNVNTDIEGNSTSVTEKGKTLNSSENAEQGSEADEILTGASISQTLSFGRGGNRDACMILGTVFAIISGLCLPFQAYIFAKTFEELSADAEGSDFLDDITEVAYAFMLIGIMMLISICAQTAFFEISATRMTNSLKSEWFAALLRQDMAYFDINNVSGASTLITTNSAIYRKGVGRKLAEAIQYSFTVIGGIAYAFWASWTVTLVVMAFAPLAMLPLYFLVQVNQSKSAMSTSSYAEAGAVAYSTMSNIRTVLSLNACSVCIEKFKAATDKALKSSARLVAYEGFLNGSMMATFMLFNITLTLYGSYLLYTGVREDGCDPTARLGNVSCDPRASDVFGSLFGIMFAAGVLPQAATSISAFSKARVACVPALKAIERVKGDHTKRDDPKSSIVVPTSSKLSLPPYEIDSSSTKGIQHDVVGHIEFKAVQFRYPSRPNSLVLRDLNLDIPSGTTIALCGASGSGKSSIAALVERFYDVSEGSITIDGINIKELNVKYLRRQIGFVQQEPVLFSTSIAENIKYGFNECTQEEIEAAAIKASAHDFIMSFPDGYNTLVGNKGSQISGGQKQRIAIARMLLRKPKILILDEATSALDAESERLVQEALNVLCNTGLTTIVIAHRLSTIRDADAIAVVGDGKIIEVGAHDELIAKAGAYSKLIEAQLGKSSAVEEITENNIPTAVDLSLSADASTVSHLAENDNDIHSIISMNGVNFSYPMRPDIQVFKDLNLSVKRGETFAIVGESGCGKSSVFSLIERFYDPISGIISIDGIDIKTMNVKSLRDKIGYVQQEPVMFNTSVRGNISFSNPNASIEDIEKAAKCANAHDFILSFPKGYDTYVGEGGSQLSGGQKQRIAIARAILNNPNILLLDEATSALDAESERIVQQALDNLINSSEHTVMIVAHRLSTVRKATRIAVFENGSVAEVGSHDELMQKKDGRYFKLVKLQMEGDHNSTTPQLVKKETTDDTKQPAQQVEKPGEVDEAINKNNQTRARLLARDDLKFLVVGCIGAALAGFVFPVWGIVFANMIDLLFKNVDRCENNADAMDFGYDSCGSYLDDLANDIEHESYDVTYQWIAAAALIIVGYTILFWGFGMASERLSKRVRDSVFESMVRQEVGYFDLNDVNAMASQIQEDAAMLHAFSGDPIRMVIMIFASVFIGLVIAFVLMWPFALIVLGILPFMMFQAELEMKMYLGEDEGDDSLETNVLSSALCIETLVNMRTVAALCLENAQHRIFVDLMDKEAPGLLKASVKHGSMAGAGMFIQNWGIALMFWWGGYLIDLYPQTYSFKDFNIAMFALLFGMTGFASATQGAADREKAIIAVDRIFNILELKSAIDPLAE